MMTLRPLVALMLTVLLASCGWQLRGTGAGVAQLDSITISGGSLALRDPLRRTFARQSVLVHSEAPTAIRITDEHWQERVIAFDALGRAVESELRLTLQWQYEERVGDALAQAETLVLSGSYERLSSNAVNASDEADRLREQLYADAARLIAQRVSALASAPGESP